MTQVDEHRLRAGGMRVVVSTTGARIVQVLSSREETPWFLPSRPVEPGEPVDFEKGARAGWDECFPSVAPAGEIEDHGSLWHRRWSVLSSTPTRVDLESDDPLLPFRARREIELLPTGVSSSLTVSARRERSVPYIFSAHPMFAWTDDAVVVVPGAGEIRRAFGEPASWESDGGSARCELAVEGRPSCAKDFVRWDGEATMTQGGRTWRITADPAVMPWLGVCVNRLAWPVPLRDQRWIALEPCTHPTDSLAEMHSILTSDARTFRVGVAEISTPRAMSRAPMKEVLHVR